MYLFLFCVMGKSLVLLVALLALVLAKPKPNINIINDTAATNFWYANMPHTGPYSGYAPCTDRYFHYFHLVTIHFCLLL